MKWYHTLLILYPAILTIAGFSSMGIDKSRAKKNQWRIRENTLFLIAFLGGSIGSLLGMYTFRHKTKHKSFVFGMPAILMLHVILGVLIKVYILKIR